MAGAGESQAPLLMRIDFSPIALGPEGHGAKEDADRCGDRLGIILVRCAKQPARAIPQVQRNIVCLRRPTLDPALRRWSNGICQKPRLGRLQFPEQKFR